MKVVVSLTTIYDNLSTLPNPLISLLNQSRMPDRIILNLSSQPYLLDKGFKNYKIPRWLKDMPIEIRWVPNNGAYRKLLPTLKELWNEDAVIITVDDDTVYDFDFVKLLVEEYEKEKNCVAYRCKLWFPNCKYVEMKDAVKKSVENFHTGKGGVLYHPSFFHGTPIFSEEFMKLCPYNDDFWFNFCRMKNKIPCVYLDTNMILLDIINEKRLWIAYNQEKNDSQMRDTYEFLFG